MNKAAIADRLVRANAFAPFRYLNRDKLLIVMYHRFSEGEEYGKTSRKTFESHLVYLKRNYQVISLTDAVRYLENGGRFPPRSAVVTVDDGYRDFYEIAFPVLEKFSVPAVIYLVTEFVGQKCWIWTDKARFLLTRTKYERMKTEINGKKFDTNLGNHNSRLASAGLVNSELKKLSDDDKERIIKELSDLMNISLPELPPDEFGPMDWNQARELLQGNTEVGSHTATHPILTNVSQDRLNSELSLSKATIENECQLARVHFCYPNGNAAARERDAVESSGYSSAVTTEISLCDPSTDRFALPRIDAEPEMYRFVQATSGFDRLK